MRPIYDQIEGIRDIAQALCDQYNYEHVPEWMPIGLEQEDIMDVLQLEFCPDDLLLLTESDFGRGLMLGYILAVQHITAGLEGDGEDS